MFSLFAIRTMFTLKPSSSEISIDLSSYYITDNTIGSVDFKYSRFNKPTTQHANNTKKRIWLDVASFVLIAACYSTGSYYVFQNIFSYYKYETIQTIQTINEPTVDFPAVSLCNSDKTKSWSTYYPKILKCSLEHNNECTDRWDMYFENYNDTYYGFCYRFNSGKNVYNQKTNILNVSTWGEPNGFLLELFVPSSVDYSRLKLFIHNRTLNPSTIYNKGFQISSGSTHLILFLTIFALFCYNLNIYILFIIYMISF